jgi:hypothetical protein
MKKKIFGIALLGFLSTLNAGVISQNGIAKDSATGLMWQDEPITEAEKTAIEKYTNNGKVGNWNYAKAYCENLTLGGYSDWRLPNIYELTTLLDNTKSSDPQVLDGIENIASDSYWSSTTGASGSSNVWLVLFSYGYDSWNDKTNSFYVRCVRAGQLNFDNLVILKNQGKVKVSQENIDKISPKKEAKRKKEAQESEKRELSFSNSHQGNSYNNWEIASKVDLPKSYDPENSAVQYKILCGNGKTDYVSFFYNKPKGMQYFTTGRAGMANLEDAANYICGN